MKKDQVDLLNIYRVKVSGKVVDVRIVGPSPYGGWIGRNLTTGREVRIKTAGRLRREA